MQKVAHSGNGTNSVDRADNAGLPEAFEVFELAATPRRRSPPISYSVSAPITDGMLYELPTSERRSAGKTRADSENVDELPGDNTFIKPASVLSAAKSPAQHVPPPLRTIRELNLLRCHQQLTQMSKNGGPPFDRVAHDRQRRAATLWR